MPGALDDFFGVLLAIVLLGAPTCYVVLQVRRLQQLHGRWRVAATVPLVPWAVWMITLLVAPGRQEPVISGLEILFGSLISMVYLWILQHYRSHRHLEAEMMGRFRL